MKISKKKKKEIKSGFPRFFCPGLLFGEQEFFFFVKKKLAHNRNPWARYWVDGLQFRELIVLLKYLMSVASLEIQSICLHLHIHLFTNYDLNF